jgi:hypothetical protein
VYVTSSTDGGQTFGPPILVEQGTNALQSSGCNTIPSGVAVDQSNGDVYALWLSGDDVVQNEVSGCNYSQLGPFDKAWVSKSTDGGLTWTPSLVWHGNLDITTQVGDNADKLFGTIAIDRSGQVHVVLPVRTNDDPVGFVADCETNPDCSEAPEPTDLLMFTSPDGGQTWTPAFRPKCPLNSHFFPWIAAGSAGRVDGIFYASPTLKPNDPTSVWYAFAIQIVGAVATKDQSGTHYVRSPRARVFEVSRGVVHNGGICTFGIFCSAVPNADRSLADSISIALDPAGGANVVYTDNASGTNVIEFACQNSGPSAYAGYPSFNGRCYGE